MAPVHIPAWKRIGLKLKYADEAPPVQPAAVQASSNSTDSAAPQGNRGQDFQEDARPAKKRRTSPQPSILVTESKIRTLSGEQPFIASSEKETIRPDVATSDPQVSVETQHLQDPKSDR